MRSIPKWSPACPRENVFELTSWRPGTVSGAIRSRGMSVGRVALKGRAGTEGPEPSGLKALGEDRGSRVPAGGSEEQHSRLQDRRLCRCRLMCREVDLDFPLQYRGPRSGPR